MLNYQKGIQYTKKTVSSHDPMRHISRSWCHGLAAGDHGGCSSPPSDVAIMGLSSHTSTATNIPYIIFQETATAIAR